MTLFAKDDFSTEVCKPGKLDELNTIFEELQARQLNRIEIHDSNSSVRLSMMMIALSQSYIRRFIELAEASAALCQQGHWLSAITISRSLLETIAAYNAITIKLEGLVAEGNTAEIEKFTSTAAFATRLAPLIDFTGEPAVKAPNILSQIDKLKKIDGTPVRNDYDYLSEHTHPNSMGTFLFFGRLNKKNKTIDFCSKGWDPKSAVDWVTWVCSMLRVPLGNAAAIEKLAGQVSKMADTED